MIDITKPIRTKVNKQEVIFIGKYPGAENRYIVSILKDSSYLLYILNRNSAFCCNLQDDNDYCYVENIPTKVTYYLMFDKKDQTLVKCVNNEYEVGYGLIHDLLIKKIEVEF